MVLAASPGFGSSEASIVRLIAADFESWPIFQRPTYPPEPVGLALAEQGVGSHYFRWGHMSGGNREGDYSAARTLLTQLWEDPNVCFIFHHARFDMAVAEERWGLPVLPWHRFHDTMFLGFLSNPYESQLGLKPLATKYLNMPAEERDAVQAWVLQHRTQLAQNWAQTGMEARVGKLGFGKREFGAWTFAAPGDIVDPYAQGDVIRTGRLFDLYAPAIERWGMGEAYDRERRLLPILMANEKVGMRLDLTPLEVDVGIYGEALDRVEEQLRWQLNSGGLNFDADQDVASVLIQSGVVPEDQFSRTKATKAHPNGLFSMSKDDVLPELFTGTTPRGATGQQIASALGYRNRLTTCLNTFMKPWLRQASINDGYITTNWSQTRGEGGARTGRATTSDHNFLNLPKDFAGRDDQYVHPAFLGVPELPMCRRYVLPDDGEVFLHRDFSGQEMRVFGHFEQGDLWDQYQLNAKLDVHDFVGSELMRVAGREIERTKIKVMNFQALYGGGAPALSNKLRVPISEAKELKRFHDQGLPGRKILNEEITRIARRGDPIRTWGGRLYWPTEPGDNGRETFYKLLNYLIQGSAADLTKQAMIEWDEANRALPPWVPPARFMVTVYDEINLSSQPEYAEGHMALLRQVMEADRLSVKMLSDGKWGLAWGRLEKYKDEDHSNAFPD